MDSQVIILYLFFTICVNVIHALYSSVCIKYHLINNYYIKKRKRKLPVAFNCVQGKSIPHTENFGQSSPNLTMKWYEVF